MVKRKRSNDNSTLAKSDKLPYLDRYLKIIDKGIKKQSEMLNEYSMQRGGGEIPDLVVMQFDKINNDKEFRGNLYAIVGEEVKKYECGKCHMTTHDYYCCTNNNAQNGEDIFDKKICQNYGKLHDKLDGSKSFSSSSTPITGGGKTKNFRIERVHNNDKIKLRLSSMGGNKINSEYKRWFTVGSTTTVGNIKIGIVEIKLKEIYIKVQTSEVEGRDTYFAVSKSLPESRFDFSFEYSGRYKNSRYGVTHDNHSSHVPNIPIKPNNGLEFANTEGNVHKVDAAGRIIVSWTEGSDSTVYFDNIVNFYTLIKEQQHDLPSITYKTLSSKNSTNDDFPWTNDSKQKTKPEKIRWSYASADQSTIVCILVTEGKIAVGEDKNAEAAKNRIINKVKKDKIGYTKNMKTDRTTAINGQTAKQKKGRVRKLFSTDTVISLQNILFIYITVINNRLTSNLNKPPHDHKYVHVLYQIYQEYSKATISKDIYNKYLESYKILIQYFKKIIDIINLLAQMGHTQMETIFKKMKKECITQLKEYTSFFNFAKHGSAPAQVTGTAPGPAPGTSPAPGISTGTSQLGGGDTHRFYIQKLDDDSLEIGTSNMRKKHSGKYKYKTGVTYTDPNGDGIIITSITHYDKSILSGSDWKQKETREYYISGEGKESDVLRKNWRGNINIGKAYDVIVKYKKVEGGIIITGENNNNPPIFNDMNIWDFYTSRLKPHKRNSYNKKVISKTAETMKTSNVEESKTYEDQHDVWKKYIDGIFEHNKNYLENQIWDEMAKLKIGDFAKYYLPYIYFSHNSKAHDSEVWGMYS